MSGSFDRDGNPDWVKGLIVTCFGKKRSGKSVMARHLFDSFPGDRVVISPNADDGPQEDKAARIFTIRGTVDSLPATWPEDLRPHPEDRITLRYVPDPGSSTFTEDCDHVIGMAFAHERTCVLVHETSDLAPSGRVPPHMRRALRQNRHAQLSMILCNPRPITIDPLVIAQSDLVYVFEVANPDDRKRIAETCGWNPADMDTAVQALRRHEFLRFDANEDKPDHDNPDEDLRLVRFKPLPPDVVKAATR